MSLIFILSIIRRYKYIAKLSKIKDPVYNIIFKTRITLIFIGTIIQIIVFSLSFTNLDFWIANLEFSYLESLTLMILIGADMF